MDRHVFDIYLVVFNTGIRDTVPGEKRQQACTHCAKIDHRNDKNCKTFFPIYKVYFITALISTINVI